MAGVAGHVEERSGRARQVWSGVARQATRGLGWRGGLGMAWFEPGEIDMARMVTAEIRIIGTSKLIYHKCKRPRLVATIDKKKNGRRVQTRIWC